LQVEATAFTRFDGLDEVEVDDLRAVRPEEPLRIQLLLERRQRTS
jgi:hypothetical protein